MVCIDALRYDGRLGELSEGVAMELLFGLALVAALWWVWRKVRPGAPPKTTWRGRWPVITEAHFAPVDELLTLTQAKQALRDLIKTVNPKIDREHLAMTIEDFVMAVRDKEESLADDVSAAKEELDDLAEQCRDLQDDLKWHRDQDNAPENDTERAEREQEIAEAEASLAQRLADRSRVQEHQKALRAELAALRKDKRAFLVEHFNTSHHGHDWRKLLG